MGLRPSVRHAILICAICGTANVEGLSLQRAGRNGCSGIAPGQATCVHETDEASLMQTSAAHQRGAARPAASTKVPPEAKSPSDLARATPRRQRLPQDEWHASASELHQLVAAVANMVARSKAPEVSVSKAPEATTSEVALDDYVSAAQTLLQLSPASTVTAEAMRQELLAKNQAAIVGVLVTLSALLIIGTILFYIMGGFDAGSKPPQRSRHGEGTMLLHAGAPPRAKTRIPTPKRAPCSSPMLPGCQDSAVQSFATPTPMSAGNAADGVSMSLPSLQIPRLQPHCHQEFPVFDRAGEKVFNVYLQKPHRGIYEDGELVPEYLSLQSSDGAQDFFSCMFYDCVHETSIRDVNDEVCGVLIEEIGGYPGAAAFRSFVFRPSSGRPDEAISIKGIPAFHELRVAQGSTVLAITSSGGESYVAECQAPVNYALVSVLLLAVDRLIVYTRR